MNLHCLNEAPPACLGEALERFEQQFWYPLGSEQRFRISHGRGYLPFFQAMGRATVLVAERGGEVLGTLTRVERHLDVLGETRLIHYLCDLKVAPGARGGRVLPRLMQETRRQIEASASHSCYAVVMGGTGRLPVDYTGRAGIPGFAKLGEIMILRFATALPAGDDAHMPHDTPWPPADHALRFAQARHELRSISRPIKLKVEEASAVLEDTRGGKCLWTESGQELISAHLTDVRFTSSASAVALIRQSLVAARDTGLPAVFVSMPLCVWTVIQAELAPLSPQTAPAAVFGYALPDGLDWWVNTAEI